MVKSAENSTSRRPSPLWLRVLQKRAERMFDEKVYLHERIVWTLIAKVVVNQYGTFCEGFQVLYKLLYVALLPSSYAIKRRGQLLTTMTL